jgi:ribonuclease P protein component
MLSANYRFHGHGSLRYLYKNGQATRSRFFVMKVVENKHRTNPRIAVVVSKKVLKSAVGRNRIRRRVYEVLRHQLGNINPLYDIVVIVTTAEVLTLQSPELQKSIIEGLIRSGVYKQHQ